MKKRRFISFVFVLILCLGMIGCGKEKKTPVSDKFQSDYMEVGFGTTVEEGYFRVLNGLLYYIDFETMEGIPICNKPNCRHISWKEDRNTKCDAANIDISTAFPHEGKLYGIRSLSDGGSELVVSDLDGGRLEIKGDVYYSRRKFSRRGCSEKSDVFSEGCSDKTYGSGSRDGKRYSNVRIES